MNINGVYLADICKVIGINEDESYRGRPIKKALVYYNRNSHKWIDLETKEQYPYGMRSYEELFIREETLVPITSVIETKKDNMSKRKIIKMYKEHNSKSGENK